MSDDLKPPEIEITYSAAEEQASLNSGTRTPRPYSHDALEIVQGDERFVGNGHAVNGGLLTQKKSADENAGTSGQTSIAASDSGTEADDERPTFIKALPAPRERLRKGLKTGESNVDVLLTPSQLDDEGRRLSKDYFERLAIGRTASRDDRKAEEEKLLRIRLGEFARRSSEVAFMGFMIVCVLCGKGVWQTAYQWNRELLSHVFIIAGLILVYPVKLSIVDSSSQVKKIWQRFRVPASFDPATVLYPTLLPVLVALSVSPANSATILPNIILGLASLPQRLFPRSSRKGDMNILHWFISIIPLLVAENTAWPSKDKPAMPYMLKSGPSNGLLPETLICLYPLHHILIQPLQYLTTTSLLISELHLLSTGLINLLFLAESPQAMILKACLWIGGVSLFLSTASILRWNVMLVRIPKWKYRREAALIGKSRSLWASLLGLMGLRNDNVPFEQSDGGDSDADEDAPSISIKQKPRVTPLSRITSLQIPPRDREDDAGPKSAVESGTHANGNLKFRTRPRSSTLPVLEPPVGLKRRTSSRRKEQSFSLLWYFDLTPTQALARRYAYAAMFYLATVTIILIPVRYYVMEKALHDQEAIGWALDYLFGQLEQVRHWVFAFGLDDWIAIPSEPVTWLDIFLRFPPDVPAIRNSFGAANTRLLLIGYWIPVLMTGLLMVFSLTTIVEVDTRRKVFHGVMVVMMLPSTFIDPCACALALTLILAVFLLLEVIRAGQVPPLGKAIGRFIAPYVDGRDLRGPVVVSHLFLLIGCAVPLWFSLASISRTGDLPWKDWELLGETREVAMISGVVCVGMGDAAASLFGRRYGRHKWPWVGGKSIEGSAAFAVAVTVGLMFGKAWLVFGGWNDDTGPIVNHSGMHGSLHCLLAWLWSLAKVVVCACGASFMEAVLTGANDNVVVPIALWIMVKGMRI